jgi:hypothetical protein
VAVGAKAVMNENSWSSRRSESTEWAWGRDKERSSCGHSRVARQGLLKSISGQKASGTKCYVTASLTVGKASGNRAQFHPSNR